MADAKIFHLVNGLFSVARGGYFVTFAWAAIDLTGSIGSSGQVFAVHHLSIILLSKFLGHYVDITPKSLVLRVGLIGFSASMICLAVVLNYWPEWSLAALFGMAMIAASSAVTVNAAMDCLQRAIFDGQDQRAMSTVVGGVRQVAMMIGAGGAGSIVASFGSDIALLCIAALLVVGASIGVSAKIVNSIEKLPEIADFRGVFQIVRSRSIGGLVLTIAISFSVGQITNALLASFVKIDLGRNGLYYGIVDSAWSIGGIAAAAFIYYFVRRNIHLNPYQFLLYMGFSLVGVAFSVNTLVIVLLHVTMGGAFVAARTICDGEIISRVPQAVLGKTRASVEGLISIFGFLAYLLPTVFQVESTRVLYFWWGAAVSMSAIAVVIWSLMMSEVKKNV